MNRILKKAGQICLATVCFACFGGLPAFAQEAGQITYHGKLAWEPGEGPDALSPQLLLRFEIFESSVPVLDEPVIWGEEHHVFVEDGRFTAFLGSDSGTPLPGTLVNDLKYAFLEGNRFLQITVLEEGPEGPEQVLLPRQQMAAVPFAFYSSNGVRPGTLAAYAGDTPPDGWVLCNGQPLDHTEPQNAALFEVIGTTYGQGDGPTEFLVPDLQGRSTAGINPQGNPAIVMSEAFGKESHSLSLQEMPSHKHNAREAGNGHQHRLRRPGAIGDDNNHIGAEFVLDWNHGNGSTSRRTQTVSVNMLNGIAGNGDPFNVIQPSLVLHYIIKL